MSLLNSVVIDFNFHFNIYFKILCSMFPLAFVAGLLQGH